MFSGINPKMMKQAMKRMGISQEDLDATEVIIKLKDREIVITEPSVAKINMQDSDSFQISGNVSERSLSAEPEINEDDIQTVMEQTGADKNTAEKAIKETNGDLAQAILNLKK